MRNKSTRRRMKKQLQKKPIQMQKKKRLQLKLRLAKHLKHPRVAQKLSKIVSRLSQRSWQTPPLTMCR